LKEKLMTSDEHTKASEAPAAADPKAVAVTTPDDAITTLDEGAVATLDGEEIVCNDMPLGARALSVQGTSAQQLKAT
jgi:hypothetical protein